MTDPDSKKGWFADPAPDGVEPHVWQPCFDTGQGHIPCFEIWFASKGECETWIAENVIGADWVPGSRDSRA